MRIVVQRVNQASVSVKSTSINQIQQGYLLLVGLKVGDTVDDLKFMAQKIRKLRIFSDAEGKMNLNITQVKGEILSISQFTLYGDVKKQNRPGFTQALPYHEAEKMYQLFNGYLRDEGLIVKEGVFGENMEVSLVNDGPVTLILNTEE
jgi:D-tyrosyl-tRNA(Tyr) deacylase